MAKTTVLIDINIGAQVPPDTLWLQWAAPAEFKSGNTLVLPVASTVKLINGQGQVQVDPGVWIVTSIGVGSTTIRGWNVPESSAPVQFNSLTEVEDLSGLGFGPTWAARAMLAALQAIEAAEITTEALPAIQEALAAALADIEAAGGSANSVIAGFVTGAGPTRAALENTYVTFLNHDGSPVTGKHVVITLTADQADIADITVEAI